MKFRLAVGRVTNGGPTVIQAQRPEPAPNVLAYDTIGDTRLALIERGDSCVATMTHTIAFGSREEVEAFYRVWVDALGADGDGVHDDSEDCPFGAEL